MRRLALLTLSALTLSTAVAVPAFAAKASFTASWSKGTLTVSDNDKGNVLDFGCVGNEVWVNGAALPGTSRACDKVKALVVKGNGGPDELSLFSVNATDYPLLAKITISGGKGDDDLYGTPLDDTLKGGSGNDDMSPYDGDDTVSGGTGRDIHRSDDVPGTVTVTDTSFAGGAGVGTDTLSGIEQVTAYGDSGFNTLNGASATIDLEIYAGDGGSSLTGGSGDDILSGNAGNDSLVGNGGDDTFEGRLGTNTFTGGAGTDGVFDTTFDSNVTLTDTTLTGSGFSTSLNGIEHAHVGVLGPTGRTINASGFTGDTQLQGYSGADTIIGGSGDDVMYPGFGTANDSMDGNGGSDVAYVYSLGDATITASTIVTESNGTDSFADVEAVTLDSNASSVTLDAQNSPVPATLLASDGGTANILIGSDFDDVIKGADVDDTLTGRSGDDLLDGKAGTDECKGGPGDDVLKNCE